MVAGLARKGGRNAYGRITTRHQGGGAARKYRLVDFNRLERSVPGKVISLEYDPNRSANIALVYYLNGSKSYILAPEGLKAGAFVKAGVDVEVKVGNCFHCAIYLLVLWFIM